MIEFYFSLYFFQIGVPDVGKHFEERNPNSNLSLTSFLENERLISLASLEDSSGSVMKLGSSFPHPELVVPCVSIVSLL